MKPTYFKTTGQILALRIDHAVSTGQFEDIRRELAQRIDSLGKVKLVITLKHYPSFNSAEDLYDDLRFIRLHAKDIEKVAIICDKKWKRTWVALFGLFSGVDMAFFDMAQASRALEWIQADGGHGSG